MHSRGAGGGNRAKHSRGARAKQGKGVAGGRAKQRKGVAGGGGEGEAGQRGGAAHLGSHAHVPEEALVRGPEGAPQQAATLLGQPGVALCQPRLLRRVQELPPQLVPHACRCSVLLRHLGVQGRLHHLKLGTCTGLSVAFLVWWPLLQHHQGSRLSYVRFSGTLGSTLSSFPTFGSAGP